MAVKSYGLKDISLKQIDIGPYQARKREVEKELDKLILSIKKMGLLYPIVVYEEEGRYKTIDGQRRVRAFEELGKETIPAIIIQKPEDDLMAKAISFSATQIHELLAREDQIDVVTALFDKYGDEKPIAEEYGISERDVRDLVGIGVVKAHAPRLWNWFSERRTEKGAIDTTLRALEASRKPDDSVDEDKAVELAEGIYPLLVEQQKEAVKVASEDPSLTSEKIVEKAREAPVIVSVSVPYEIYERFEERIRKEGISRSEGARKAIEQWVAG
ncbi:MAG: ParB N-terminal domain-containing protein [Candidatus Bathyarchaeia archaeon]